MFHNAKKMLQRKQSHWTLRRRRKFHGATVVRCHSKNPED
jgi:hypothetical protein